MDTNGGNALEPEDGDEPDQPSELQKKYSENFERSNKRSVTLTRSLTHPALCSLVYGVHSIQNTRKEMEDAHQAVLSNHDGAEEDKSRIAEGLGDFSFFGVFDGHGGTLAAEFASERICTALTEETATLSSDPSEALRRAFAKTESEWIARAKAEELLDGTTAAVALIDRVEGRCFIGNVGDSEIVLGSKDASGEIRCEVLTEVHNVARNPAERERIEAAGGRIWKGRLAHPKLNPRFCSLAISRAIGDLFYKDDELLSEGANSGLTAEPYIRHAKWDPSDHSGQILIIGCDGLWDTVSYAEAVELAFNRWRARESPQVISEALVKLAQDTGSSDNITVMVVVF